MRIAAQSCQVKVSDMRALRSLVSINRVSLEVDGIIIAASDTGAKIDSQEKQNQGTQVACMHW